MRIHDGAYGTLLERHLRGDETADDLCLREPAVVIAAHVAYLDAGATSLQTNAFLAWMRSSERRRAQLQLAALACAREAAATVSSGEILVAATIGPGSDEPRDYWRDLELLLDDGARGIQVETITDRSIADAFLAAWAEVAAGVRDVDVRLGCSVAPSVGAAAQRWVLELAADAPEEVHVGLNCCEGPTGLRPLLSELCELRERAWVMPSAGVPFDRAPGQSTTWPLARPQDWRDATMELVADLPVSLVGGCCGTTPETIAALAEA
ncbi:MAG: metH [Thermoleophilia bacterium]|nr:metH [Thermoleophilia bacterium]